MSKFEQLQKIQFSCVQVNEAILKNWPLFLGLISFTINHICDYNCIVVVLMMCFVREKREKNHIKQLRNNL